MRLLRVLSTVSLSHLRGEWLKGLLFTVGLSLGIAAFVAIRIAEESVLETLDRSEEALSQRSSLQVVSPNGMVPESIVRVLRQALPDGTVLPMSASYEQVIAPSGDTTLAQVIGTDLLSGLRSELLRGAPGISRETVLRLLRLPLAALVGSAFTSSDRAESIHVVIGGERRALEVVGSLRGTALDEAFGGRVLVLDIAHYQLLLSSYGTVERLLLFGRSLVENAPHERERLSRLLPPPLIISDEREEPAQLRRMTRAYRLNLNLLALISLGVSVLLIYNTVGYAVLKRRRELGILRALGASVRFLFGLLFLESLLLGLAASLMGVLGGVALSVVSRQLVERSFSALYTFLPEGVGGIDRNTIVQAFLLGTGAVILGSLMPLFEIFRIPPRENFSYENFEKRFREYVPWLTGGGVIALVGAFLALPTEGFAAEVSAGIVSPLFLLGAVVLLTPAVVIGITGPARFVVSRVIGISAVLALDHIRATLGRNGAAISAMSVALSLFVGLSTMVGSFRVTVAKWIEAITQADLYISSGGVVAERIPGTLSDEFVAKLCSMPEVRECDWVMSRTFVDQGWRVRLNGIRFPMLVETKRLQFLEPMTHEELLSVTARNNIAFVSEAYANRFRVKRGGEISLTGVENREVFTVANIYADYSTDQGVVLISDEMFQRLEPGAKRRGVSLYLRDQEAAERVRQKIREEIPELSLGIRKGSELRSEVLDVFDETFEITALLQFVTLLVSGCTVLSSMLMLILEREREFAVLRALGATDRQLVWMVAVEAGVLGFIALVIGLVAGAALSLILVIVVRRAFFGWSIELHFDPLVFISVAAGLLALSIVAGLLPGRWFARKVSAGLLRYE